jgi:hypothetical protein
MRLAPQILRATTAGFLITGINVSGEALRSVRERFGEKDLPHRID